MQSKFRITQSLLSAWQWSFVTDRGFGDFLRVLNRQGTKQSEAMLEGIRFENCINGLLNGEEIEPSNSFYKPARQLARYLNGSQQQVTLFRDLNVDGVTFLMHGVLDYLRAGVVYDTKYSKTYRVGKYLTSPQHPMYLYLVPEAREFQYLIYDGKDVARETYRRDEVAPIENVVRQFMAYLETYGLVDIFFEKWRV